jgi:hypothetical protein
MGLEPTTFCMANPGGTLPEAKLREDFGLPEVTLLPFFWLASYDLRVFGVGGYGCAILCANGETRSAILIPPSTPESRRPCARMSGSAA